MIKSMTGFGRGAYADDVRDITVEIRSVNHRYSDITVKMPRRYSSAEEPMKALVKQVAPRGKSMCTSASRAKGKTSWVYV